MLKGCPVQSMAQRPPCRPRGTDRKREAHRQSKDARAYSGAQALSLGVLISSQVSFIETVVPLLL